MKDLLITKAQVDATLVKFAGFEIVKQSDAQYTLNIDNGGVLNIYFKKNGKTSFLSQGQDPLVATNFAQALINLIQFPKDADECQELITIGSNEEDNPLYHVHVPMKISIDDQTAAQIKKYLASCK
ncbi:hypothetical protein [Burkholderia cenocepacia]|uniref:hypothetical protein n=1 Tax=Burkholderia cenocepacia TaxID=95486 RepID=UPI002238EFF7|nr:hypothetical protein [Burkholderia cenocepacia]MCW5156332.1 hypothetical protein [Burkholderia cenocepacia]